MALVKFFQINTQNHDLSRVQDNISRALEPLYNTPTLGGNLLQQVSLLTGINTINHKLGRNLVGWQIVRQRAAASIYDDQDNNLTPNLTLSLISSAPVVCDIYVF